MNFKLFFLPLHTQTDTSIMKTKTTYTTIHPGMVLKEVLDEKGLSNKEFASTIGMPASVLSDIINGKRSVTPDIAILLEASLGRDAASWLAIQAARDIEVAKAKEEFLRKQEDIETWKSLQNYCNVRILEKVIPGGLGKNTREKINCVFSFFGVEDLYDLRTTFLADVNPSFFRKSSIVSDPVNLFTWKYMAFFASEKSPDPLVSFDSSNLNVLIPAVKETLFANHETLNNLHDLLSCFGIRLVILPNQQGTHIDGFSFWRGEWPTITLTLRGQKLDILAFTLLHEIYHAYKHLHRGNFEKTCISIDGEKDSLEEKEADTFARNSLIPSVEWQLFKASCLGVSPYAMGPRIRAFSEEHGIHPSIVLGRYQHEFNVFDNGRGIERSIN